MRVHAQFGELYFLHPLKPKWMKMNKLIPIKLVWNHKRWKSNLKLEIKTQPFLYFELFSTARGSQETESGNCWWILLWELRTSKEVNPRYVIFSNFGWSFHMYCTIMWVDLCRTVVTPLNTEPGHFNSDFLASKTWFRYWINVSFQFLNLPSGKTKVDGMNRFGD